MSRDRLRQVEKNLNRLRQQLAGKEDTLVTIAPEEKVRIKQQIDDLKAEIKPFEIEYWQILANESDAESIAEPKADVIVAEIVESVDRLAVQQDYSAEIMQVLVELRDRLNQPQTPVAIKVKWVLSAIPPFVGLATEGELDLEKFWQTNFPTFRQWSKALAKKL
ncbi:MAG: hypothetical protein HC866_26920 [Leptolyngbyaceae cyanobacterium RU_5_1]|nr:hypothetical protein [Leptolyngbyaceae cyanobacterium RU_5_1]